MSNNAGRAAPRQNNPLYIEQTTAATSLASKIGREIVGGAFKEQAVLPNEIIMRGRYNVSRTALREAYSKLTAKGLLLPRPKVGTCIRGREHWNMLDQDVLSWHLQTLPASDIAADLYELRKMIEPGAAELAALKRTDADIDRIDAAFADMRAFSGNETDLVDADYGFHVAILEATHNPFINAFSALIRAAMISTFELSWRGAEIIKETRLEQHGAVAEAIRAKNPQLASTRMERLLEDSMRDVEEALKH
ncbi:MAG: FadR family transcriptional regulator [Rhodobacteraceae bacterium]|nr:FadR family transcriptional regulator [Paracoccaceae bacterium]PHR53645.1 MAG: GntR family transcriptional regulator [Robiginitomaculum sp.]